MNLADRAVGIPNQAAKIREPAVLAVFSPEAVRLREGFNAGGKRGCHLGFNPIQVLAMDKRGVRQRGSG